MSGIAIKAAAWNAGLALFNASVCALNVALGNHWLALISAFATGFSAAVCTCIVLVEKFR